jgi:hypothetical protein
MYYLVQALIKISSIGAGFKCLPTDINPLTAATSLGAKSFRVLNTTINIKDILWRRLGNYKIWRIYTSATLKGLISVLVCCYRALISQIAQSQSDHRPIPSKLQIRNKWLVFVSISIGFGLLFYGHKLLAPHRGRLLDRRVARTIIWNWHLVQVTR